MSEYETAVAKGYTILKNAEDNLRDSIVALSDSYLISDSDNSMNLYLNTLIDNTKIRTGVLENLVNAINEIETIMKDCIKPAGGVLEHPDYMQMMDTLTEYQVTLMKRMHIQCHLLDGAITARMIRLENNKYNKITFKDLSAV
jgi:hypothetical protein